MRKTQSVNTASQQRAKVLKKIHPELNLEKWAIWKPSKSPKKVLKPQILNREISLPDGSTLRSQVQVGFTERGTLTTEDRKTYYALIKIWEEKGRPHGLVPLSLRRLAHELNKKWGTNVITALTQSLLRLRVTPFTWENSYYNAQSGETERLLTAFNILEDVKIIKRARDGHTTKQEGYFRFNNYILRNLFNNHTKPLYLVTLLKFQTEIAQLLYVYLDLIMADKYHYERKSAGLFQDLGLEAKAYRKPSIRKQKLLKALTEMQGVPLTTGILQEAKIVPSKTDKDFKVVFTKRAFRAIDDGAGDPDIEVIPPPAADCKTETCESRTVAGRGIHPKDADAVVLYFHQQLGRPQHQPTARELDQANGLLLQHGMRSARFVVDYAIHQAKQTDFQMQTFGAALQYQGQALAAYAYRQQQQELFETHRKQTEQAAQVTPNAQTPPVAEQLDLLKPVETTHEQLQAQFDALDAGLQARLRGVAEAKLASHEDRMKPDVYQETLTFVLFQEMQTLKV